MENVATKIGELRDLIDKNRQLRATAEANITFAKNRREQIDNRLREIGINPDNADQELKDMEEAFEVMAAQLKIELVEEASRYNDIINKLKVSTGEIK